MTQVHDDGLSEWNLLWTPDQSHCRDGLSTFSLPTAGKEANHLTLTQISNQNASNLGAVDNPTGCHRFPSLPHPHLPPFWLEIESPTGLRGSRITSATAPPPLRGILTRHAARRAGPSRLPFPPPKAGEPRASCSRHALLFLMAPSLESDPEHPKQKALSFLLCRAPGPRAMTAPSRTATWGRAH